MYGHQGLRMGARDREFEMAMYTLLYLKRITNKTYCIGPGPQCSM